MSVTALGAARVCDVAYVMGTARGIGIAAGMGAPAAAECALLVRACSSISSNCVTVSSMRPSGEGKGEGTCVCQVERILGQSTINKDTQLLATSKAVMISLSMS